MDKLERDFQADLIIDLTKMFPGCFILKNDPNYIQGIPDLIILHNTRWATLECKKSAKSPHQPNQDWYVDVMNEMSFSSFIYPENRQEVLDGLQQALEPRRRPRISKRV